MHSLIVIVKVFHANDLSEKCLWNTKLCLGVITYQQVRFSSITIVLGFS